MIQIITEHEIADIEDLAEAITLLSADSGPCTPRWGTLWMQICGQKHAGPRTRNDDGRE
jgi:hypothetical protein